MSLPANIRINVGAPFPAIVKGLGPVRIGKQNGVWTVWLNQLFTLLAGSTAVTPPVGDNSTLIATTAFVQQGIAVMAKCRLTLTPGTSVMTASVAGAAAINLTAHDGGNVIPVMVNGVLTLMRFPELSNILANSAVGNAGPAAAVANSLYNLLVWYNPNTNALVLTRSAPWSSLTNPGAGAPLETLVGAPGLLFNGANIANGPLAGQGTYVGIIGTNGAALVDFNRGSIGTAAKIMLWNAFNRVPAAINVTDPNSSWTYNVANTWRAANAGAFINSITMVRGLDIDPVAACYKALGSGAGSASMIISGIGLDSTVAPAASSDQGADSTNAGFTTLPASYNDLPGQGQHVLTALEYNTVANNSSWFGSNPAFRSSGFKATVWY